MIHQRLKLISLFVLMGFLNSEKVSGCDDVFPRTKKSAWNMVNIWAEYIQERQKNLNISDLANQIVHMAPSLPKDKLLSLIEKLIKKTNLELGSTEKGHSCPLSVYICSEKSFIILNILLEAKKLLEQSTCNFNTF